MGKIIENGKKCRGNNANLRVFSHKRSAASPGALNVVIKKENFRIYAQKLDR